MGILAGIDTSTWLVLIAICEAFILLRALLVRVSWRGAAVTACFGLGFAILAVAGREVDWYWLAAAQNALLYAVVAAVRLLLHRGGARWRRS